MRKKLILTLGAALLSLSLLAQGTVSTKKYRLSDFSDKQTMVVLGGNEFISSTLRQEVSSNWTASAFEFCTPEQFEARKTDPRYDFLLTVDTQFKGEETPSLSCLCLLKGGPEAAEGLSAMQEVISLPLSGADGGTGRELVYMGALARSIQEYVQAAMESERVAMSPESWFNEKYGKWGRMRKICLAREDLAPSVSDKELEKFLDEDFILADADEVDATYLQGDYNTLVSYVVAPAQPEKGSWCYKMLIEADTHSIYYLSRHKISDKKGVGFLPEDLKKLARKR